MKMIKTLGLTLAAAGLMTLTVQAVPITGDISFGSFQPLTFTGGATFLLATGFDFVNADNAVVNAGASGSFSILPALTPARFYDFTFAPLPGGGVDPVWTVTLGGFSFALGSVNVTRTSTSITLDGLGTVSSSTPGLESNSGDFHFSVQGNDVVTTSFSFSADNHSPSARIPDGGATVMLLGAALSGLAWVNARRK